MTLKEMPNTTFTNADTLDRNLKTQKSLLNMSKPSKQIGFTRDVTRAPRTNCGLAKKVAKLVLPIAIIMLLASFLVNVYSKEILELCNWLDGNKPWSVFVFVAVYVIWVSAGLSLSLLSIIGGYTFGLLWGLFAAVFGMLASQMLSLVILRSPCSCSVRLRAKLRNWLVGQFTVIRVLEAMMDEQPVRACTMLRFTLIPTFAKNYGMAALDAPLVGVIIGNLLSGIFFGTVFCYITAKDLSKLVKSESAEKETELILDEKNSKESPSWVKYLSLSVGLIFTIAAMIVIKKRVKLEIQKSEDEHKKKEELNKVQKKEMITVGSIRVADANTEKVENFDDFIEVEEV